MEGRTENERLNTKSNKAEGEEGGSRWQNMKLKYCFFTGKNLKGKDFEYDGDVSDHPTGGGKPPEEEWNGEEVSFMVLC